MQWISTKSFEITWFQGLTFEYENIHSYPRGLTSIGSRCI